MRRGADGAQGPMGPQGPAGVGDLGCTTDQIIKWNDATTSWECYDQITNSISDTESGDVTLFDDGVVRIWLDNTTTDDIELEITNNFAPTGSVYHVSWTNFQSPSGTPGSVTNMVDLNAGGATSSYTLDFSFTTDEFMTIRIWSPVLGLSWGFYEISIIKSSSLYTGSPVICSVTVS